MEKKYNKSQNQAVKTTAPVSSVINNRLIYLILGAFAILLYANTINSDYTVDDGTVIKNNKYTTAGISSIGKIFSSAYRAGFWDRKEGLYRPVSVAMFAVEWQIAPGKPLPGHVINILLYALTSVILYSVLKKLLRNYHPLIPIIATLLFIAHPVHTEVVANIKSRDEILSLLFGLSASWFLMLYIKKGKNYLFILSVIIYFFALFSKENSITWIGIFPLILWFATDMKIKKIIIHSLPFLAAGILFLLIRNHILGTSGTNYELLLINNSLIGSANYSDRIATAVFILGKYLWLLVFPANLVFDYSYSTIPIMTAGSFPVIISFVILAGLIIYALRKIKNKEMISFGILFFLGTIILVSNIFFLIEATMAERFLYTPSLGFCIVASVFISYLLLKKSQKDKTTRLTVKDIRTNISLVIPVIIILLLFSVKTISRNADWKNNLTLLSQDVKSSPNSARIRYAYGSALLFEKALKENNKALKNELLDLSIEQLQKGVSIIPNYNDAWYHLGLAYKEKEEADNAVAAFEQARSYKAFSDADHFSGSGIAYGMAGKYDKAIADLREAAKYDSASADSWNNLGLYLSEAGKHDESLQAFKRSLLIDKKFHKAYYNRGNAWAKVNMFRNAIDDYKTALSIKPDYGDALNNIGNCYAAMQITDSAKIFFEKAVNADPQNAKAALNLGITLRILGDSAGAMQYLQRAQAAGLIK